jgi:hypothetical protein
VTGDDAIGSVDQNRDIEAELTDGCGDLVQLLFGMKPRIARIGLTAVWTIPTLPMYRRDANPAQRPPWAFKQTPTGFRAKLGPLHSPGALPNFTLDRAVDPISFEVTSSD